ncbi:MAG TPA: glycosyltransferase family 87 protein [Chthoniobacterales bacterium]|nr:glycosyltransferase family 87 protein [Chthoniobacterales bacterium]
MATRLHRALICVRGFAKRLGQPRTRLFLHVFFITTAITFTLIPFIRFLRSGTDMDYRTWYQAGQTVLHGGEIYPHGQTFPFMYPPTCALMLAVPAFFGKPVLILFLSLVNTVAWLLCISFISALLSEKRIQNSPVVIANLILVPFVWSSYHLGQPSLILLALMLAAFLALPGSRKGEILAGTLIALASAIKAFPLLAIFYLIYRRYWAATVSLVIGLLLLLLVAPIPFRGLQRTIADARDWQRGMLRYRETTIAQRPARGYSWKNQSIFGVANRLLRHVSVNDEPNPPAYANVINLDFRTVNIVIITCALVAGAFFVWVIPRHRSAANEEFAALLILILIFTPLTFGYLFVWLMLPLALLIKRIIAANEAPLMSYLLIALVLLTLTAIAPRFAQIYGSLFSTALVLYLALATSLRHSHFLRQSASGRQGQEASVDSLALR